MMNIQTLKDEQEEVQLCISAEGYYIDTSLNSMLVQSCHAESIKEYFILSGNPCRIVDYGPVSFIRFTYPMTS